MRYDTIAAISTPPGEGGIAVIRISGPRAMDITEKIFFPKSKRPLKDIRSFSLCYGHIRDNLTQGTPVVDEALVSLMRGKKTYSGEDTAEINCHGGRILAEKILSLTLKNGARLAEKGEFTKRAFLNGRIDLTRAEAVRDLIEGKSDGALTLALKQLRGDLAAGIEALREKILAVSAHVNVVLDYPEEGIEEPFPANLTADLQSVNDSCEALIASYDAGKLIRDGVKTAIVGKPNVGKSSLLNALLREERAIVTEIPGTTRDTIVEEVKIKGIRLVLVDTAGIRQTADTIEAMGVKKSRETLEEADLILFVTDASVPLDGEDLAIYENIGAERYPKTLWILNKIDKGVNEDKEAFPGIKARAALSALTGEGIKALEETIGGFLLKEEKETAGSRLILTNIRHKAALSRVSEALSSALSAIAAGYPADLMALDLKEAADALGEITGAVSTEDLLDRIFRDFCVGK
ncbi:MAG: tRNA uridine-5-carboxymethylaminomethyl(34) synthesis GTPase MnmE [Fusobacteriaceae bacterium]|nr:tRNA uridine-5-carboxymethylaminomethyl(34) synthesis GTPase MnmE [Fusobacteriaceae bacterium]